MLFTLEQAKRLKARRSKATINCFSPGLIPSSGLFRSQNVIFRTIFDFAATNIIRVAASVSEGGDTLVYMVESDELEGQSGLFLATPPGKPRSLFGVREVSKEASDPKIQKKLWDLSQQVLQKAGVTRKVPAAGLRK